MNCKIGNEYIIINTIHNNIPAYNVPSIRYIKQNKIMWLANEFVPKEIQLVCDKYVKNLMFA